MASSNTSNN
jgi:cellulose synthase/poly-beta-1,6-N-acetylglucosamine synthase-like glycosyltransferase